MLPFFPSFCPSVLLSQSPEFSPGWLQKNQILPKNQLDMLAIFTLGYVASATGFYFLLSRSAKPIPFPNWIWTEHRDAEVIELGSSIEKAA